MDGGGVLGSGGGGLVGGGTNWKKTGAFYNYRYSLFSVLTIQYILIIFTLTLQREISIGKRQIHKMCIIFKYRYLSLHH